MRALAVAPDTIQDDNATVPDSYEGVQTKGAVSTLTHTTTKNKKFCG